MAASEARIAANRRNAQKSTGPKTEAGKARSRLNGFKHGLTGLGVALPIEDQAEVERRYRALGDDLRPTCERERMLARRAAFLSFRVERCEKFEVSALSESIREAVADYDDARQEEVDDAIARLADEPRRSVRRLRRTPEGLDWLLETWATLARDIPVGFWGFNHVKKAETLMGWWIDDVGYSTVNVLSAAMNGDFRLMDPMDAPEPTDPGVIKARKDRARADLLALVEAEVARLRTLRAAIDEEALAKSRAEAPLRRLFNPSNAALLFRRYETAASRELFKILQEFPPPSQDEAEPTSSQDEQTTCEALGSCGTPDVDAPSTPEAEGSGGGSQPVSEADEDPTPSARAGEEPGRPSPRPSVAFRGPACLPSTGLRDQRSPGSGPA